MYFEWTKSASSQVSVHISESEDEDEEDDDDNEEDDDGMDDITHGSDAFIKIVFLCRQIINTVRGYLLNRTLTYFSEEWELSHGTG